jgi:hypothetical protein
MSEPRGKSCRLKIFITAGVCLFFGFLLGVGIPKFNHARQTSLRLACMNHLIQIDGAKQQWAKEKQKNDADIPTWADLKPYIAHNVELQCPAGGVYTIGKVSEVPSCSIANHSLQ